MKYPIRDNMPGCMICPIDDQMLNIIVEDDICGR